MAAKQSRKQTPELNSIDEVWKFYNLSTYWPDALACYFYNCGVRDDARAGFFVFRPHHDDKGDRQPRAGLIGNQCAATPDNGEIPTEYSCEKP
jgi:hypothetical protein